MPKSETGPSEHANRPRPEAKVEQKPEPLPEVKPPSVSSSLSAEKVQQIRADKLSRLKKYSSGIRFKIRVPDGRNLIVQAEGSEEVQYIFDFIENQPEDLGFSNELERKFDVCVGFGSGETLKGKERTKLG